MPGSTKTGGDTHDALRSEVVARLLRGELGMREACERHGLTPELIGDWVRDFRRSTLKAFDEHVRATLSSQGVDTAAFSAAELTGTLDEVAVSDLIQTMDLSRRDCEISVAHAGLESRLWCSGGEVVAAESGQLSGEAALYRILALEQGEVVADFRPVRRERTIWKPTPVLLLDGARRKDECHRLRSRLGRERYAPGANLPSVGATFTRTEIELLRAFDGPRSVGDALASSPFGDLETLTAFANLVKRECLLPMAEVVDAPQVVAPPDAISLRPALVSLLALAPRVSRAPADPRRMRIGLTLAGSLLAASALWLLPRFGNVRDTARDDRTLTSTAALGAPEAIRKASPDEAKGEAAHVPAVAVAPALPAPVPATAPEPSSPPRPTARPHEASAPRSTPARVRAPRPAMAAPATAPSEPPRTPRMQIIEDRNPSIRVLE